MWFSIILLGAGWLVMSPAASLLMAVIVVLSVLPVVFFGKFITCLIGAAVLAGAIGLAATHYTEAKDQLSTYRNHARKTRATAPAPLPPGNR